VDTWQHAGHTYGPGGYFDRYPACFGHIRDSGQRIFGEAANSEEDREYRCYIANELIQKVPQRERDVVINYFGLYDTPQGQTLEDISSRLQISKERVRQLRNQGLDRMRKHLGIHTKEAK